MDRYAPLRNYLTMSGDDRVVMSYRQITGLVGKLPPEAETGRGWWINSDSGDDRTLAWLAAGYRAQPNPVRQSVVFWKASR